MAINYPYRVFRYQVEIDGISRAGFSEVSGMSASTDAGEYREGDDLRNTPRTNTAPPTGMVRHNVTITLFDDAGNPGPSWELINAWPVGYTVPDLNGMGGEVAIQSLELCHEGLQHTPGSVAGAPSTI